MTRFGAWRASLAGLGGGLAWLVGLRVVFGPAQAILTDPQRQSSKMLAAFGTEGPPPHAYEMPWVVPAGILGIGLLYGWCYAAVARGWRGGWVSRGARFGVLAWALMVPWFEFYLPWNVLREPGPLVVLEVLCWAAVLQLVGLCIAGVDTALGRVASRPH